jgi:hypothetical protein
MALWKEWLAGGVANAATSALLNPLDVAKTIMQTRAPPLQQPQAPQPGLLATLSGLYRAGGLRGVYAPGLTASIVREMIYSGAKAGMYVPCRSLYLDCFGGQDAAAKVAAALTTGTLGSLAANPIDVVKIRLMREPTLYPSTAAALPAILRAEGLAGLYRGLAPSTLRGACVSAGELACYDVIKGELRGRFFQGADTLPLHVAASLVTGLVAACVAAPWDLIKARAMASTGARPESIASVLRQLAAEGGLPLSLFRGLLPAYLRLGPHALIAFPIFEQLRAALGLSYL